jgi:hypothetical protein
MAVQAQEMEPMETEPMGTGAPTQELTPPTESLTGDDLLQENTNPLNPAGDSLERLIQLQINEDAWSAMLGELPCIDASEVCVRELQEMAIANDTTLAEIDARIQAINDRIEQARENNQRSINLGIFEPLWQDLIRVETVQRVPDPSARPVPGSIVVQEERGFLDNVLDIFRNPVRGINNILSLIGVPLFRTVSGGDPAVQQRQIQITDLQVKVAEVERSRAEMANKLREEVLLQVLEFERVRREFQGEQEIGRRATLRTDILTLNYRFAVGGMTTPQYLAELNGLDNRRLTVFRQWAQLRTQLTRIKLLVLGAENV